MMLRRCAWCGKFLGLKWGGWRRWFKTTDGLCEDCYADVTKNL